MKSILKASAAVAALLVLSAGGAQALCVLTGTSGDDTLTATPSLPPCNWTIEGFAGDDTLTGGPGDDRLWLGSQSIFHSGHDTATGNGGADIFFIEDTAASLGSQAQEITDFTHSTDFINLFPVCHAHSVTCSFIGSAAFSGTAGEVRYGIASGSAFGVMQIDLDGDATSDFDIKLDGAPAVTAGDIQFVLPPRKAITSNAR